LSAQPSYAIRHIPKDGPGFQTLERYGFRLDRLRALSFLVTQDLFGKPVSTFPDHALGH
jgi:hypothetical protein